jgi:hypothetical protein
MDTFLYTSDIDGIHNRINTILHGKQTNTGTDSISNTIGDNVDYSDFGASIGNSGDGNSINTNNIVTDKTDNDGDGEDILKKKYEQMSAVEMRTCEMEMVKYKQMLAQHKYERGFRKKASVLEREMNSKTKVKECNSLTDFAKALDVSHSKWKRCAKKTKEKYIKEFVYRKHGIPIEKKSRKGRGGAKKGKISAFNVASINLNNCESGAEPNICIKNTGGAGKQASNKNKKEKEDKNKIEITEEITKELEKYLQNLTNNIYDDPGNITYDHKNKRIEELAL